jgi:Domain of unknown function (DUF4337)
MPDSPTEQIDDDIMDHAREARQPWINWAATTAAVLAALAAVTGAMSTKYLTASNRSQIQANDQWSYYQAKSIKASQLRTKMELLAALGKGDSETDRTKADQYEHDLEKIKKEADENTELSEAMLQRHEVLEWGETLFHIAIAVVAIAVLASRRSLWYLSMIAGTIGIVFLVMGLWPGK